MASEDTRPGDTHGADGGDGPMRDHAIAGAERMPGEDGGGSVEDAGTARAGSEP